MKYLDRTAIPVLDYVVVCGEASVDELPQLLADGLPTASIGDAWMADGVVGKPIEAGTKSLVIEPSSNRVAIATALFG